MEKDIRYSFEENLKQEEWKKQKVIGKRNLLEQEYMQTYSNYAEGNISQTEFLQYKSTYQEKAETYKQQENVCVKEEKRIRKCQAALQKLIYVFLYLETLKFRSLLHKLA